MNDALGNSSLAPPPVLVVSGYGDTEIMNYALELGAKDFIRKSVANDQLMTKIDTMLA